MEEFRSYLSHHFPKSDLDDFYPVFKDKPHRRVPLGLDQPEGSRRRIRQAVRRGTAVFRRVFPRPDSPMWVLVNDWDQHEAYPVDGDHLYDLFDPRVRSEFQSRVITRKIGPDQHYEYEQRLLRTDRKSLNVAAFLEGKANVEQGRLPGITQMVFCVNPDDHRMFFMIDATSCIVYGQSKKALQDVQRLEKSWTEKRAGQSA